MEDRRSGGGGGAGAEGKAAEAGGAAPTGPYFTAWMTVLFACLTALLVFLPLVLPPLPPPPSLLLLLPVGLLALLLALAFLPADGRRSSIVVTSSCL